MGEPSSLKVLESLYLETSCLGVIIHFSLLCKPRFGFPVLVAEGILLKAYISDGQTHQDRTKMPGCSLSEMMLELILKE